MTRPTGRPVGRPVGPLGKRRSVRFDAPLGVLARFDALARERGSSRSAALISAMLAWMRGDSERDPR